MHIRTSHILAIDAIRFVAALLVVFFHLCFWIWAYPIGATGRAALNLIQPFHIDTLFFQNGWVGVEIFFVVSGFVIAFSSERATAFSFFVSRVVRLVPAVWIIAPLTLLTWFALGATGYLVGTNMLARSISFIPIGPWVDSVYWTLGVETVFYFGVWLLIRLHKYRHLQRAAVVIGTISTCYWISYWVAPGIFEKSSAWRSLDLLLVHHGCFFALGIYIYRHFIKSEAAHPFLSMTVFLLGGCLQISAECHLQAIKTGLDQPVIWPTFIWLLAIISMILGIKTNGQLQSIPNLVPYLRTLGLMTYPLYLFHNVIGAAIMGQVVKIGESQVVALLIAVTIAVVSSYVIAKKIEPQLQKSIKNALQASRVAQGGCKSSGLDS